MTSMYDAGDEDMQGEPVPQDLVVRTGTRDVVELSSRRRYIENGALNGSVYVYHADKPLKPEIEGCNLNEILLTKKRYEANENGGRKLTRAEMKGQGNHSSNAAQFPKVFSALNQFCVRLPDGMTEKQFLALLPEERKYLIRRHLNFAGIVGTRLDADGWDKDRGGLMLSVRTKGVMRLTNTGFLPIEQGKAVMWDVLDVNVKTSELNQITGTPEFKVLAVPVSMIPENILSVETVNLKAHMAMFKFVKEDKPDEGSPEATIRFSSQNDNFLAAALFDLNQLEKAPTYENVCADMVRFTIASFVIFAAVMKSKANMQDLHLNIEEAFKDFESKKALPWVLVKTLHILMSGPHAKIFPTSGDTSPAARSFITNVCGRMVTTNLRAALDASERRIGRAQTSAASGKRFDCYVY